MPTVLRNENATHPAVGKGFDSFHAETPYAVLRGLGNTPSCALDSSFQRTQNPLCHRRRRLTELPGAAALACSAEDLINALTRIEPAGDLHIVRRIPMDQSEESQCAGNTEGLVKRFDSGEANIGRKSDGASGLL